MASIDYIMKRIEGKEKEIAKLTKKLERIHKAQATNWEVNPYWYSEYDLKYTTRDLEDAKRMLEDYKAKLATETEKANSRNVKAIIEFLEAWKARVEKFYGERFAKYPAALEQYQEDMKQFDLDYYEERKLKKEKYLEWLDYNERRSAVKEAFQMRFGFLDPYISRKYNPETQRYDLWQMDEEKLAKDLKEDANRKYDNIIERTNEICGTIKDAAGLKVGDKGELDGYVIGERGTAHVHTIGAGGYNIQCFHFRVLVHELKK